MDNNTTVLITGACGGLGRAAAFAFAEKGYRVFAADVRAFEDPPEGVTGVIMDVTDDSSVESAAGKLGPLDLIVHLAGIYTMDSFIEIPTESLQRMIDVNLMGAVRVNRAFFPNVRMGSGRIIIVASELAPLDPLPFNGIYSVTKRALDGYAHSLALELDLLGIRVTTVYPGAYGDGMTQAAIRSMERMSRESKLYPDVAERFRRIVLSEIGKKKPPKKFAERLVRLADKRKPPFRVFMNNSLKLGLFSAMPIGLQAFVLRRLLK